MSFSKSGRKALVIKIDNILVLRKTIIYIPLGTSDYTLFVEYKIYFYFVPFPRKTYMYVPKYLLSTTSLDG